MGIRFLLENFVSTPVVSRTPVTVNILHSGRKLPLRAMANKGIIFVHISFEQS